MYMTMVESNTILGLFQGFGSNMYKNIKVLGKKSQKS